MNSVSFFEAFSGGIILLEVEMINFLPIVFKPLMPDGNKKVTHV